MSAAVGALSEGRTVYLENGLEIPDAGMDLGMNWCHTMSLEASGVLVGDRPNSY